MTPPAGRQVGAALVPGVVVGVVVGLVVRAGTGPLAGYDAAALVYIARVWKHVWPLDGDESAKIATREDPTKPTADLILLTAALASLGAIAAAIIQGHNDHGGMQTAEFALGAGSVVVSWLVVHTIFALRYARLYYGGPDPEGGVKFDGADRPPYTDFAYVAFTIGMTFQVSDTDFQTIAFRRLALQHALISYLFGAVILAASINLVAGLAS